MTSKNSSNVVKLDQALVEKFHEKYSGDAEFVEVIYENARTRLNALLMLHVASIGRSTTFTGIVIILATALLGFLATRISIVVENDCSGFCSFEQAYNYIFDDPLLVAGFVLFISYVISAYYGAKAADPTMLNIVGYRPGPTINHFANLDEKFDKQALLEANYINLDESISDMESVLNKKNGNLNSAILSARHGTWLAPLSFLIVISTDFSGLLGI